MNARINFAVVQDSSWFEPSAGEEVEVIKRGKSVSWIMYYGEKKKISNRYLDFDQPQ